MDERGPFDSRANCVIFALGLQESYYETVEQLIREDSKYNNPRFLASTYFLKYLIDNNVLTPIELEENVFSETMEKMRCDCFVIYFEDNKIKHIGKYNIVNGKVTSKWGNGSVIMHSLEQVPISYGNKYGFYESDEKTNFNEDFDKFLEVSKLETTD